MPCTAQPAGESRPHHQGTRRPNRAGLRTIRPTRPYTLRLGVTERTILGEAAWLTTPNAVLDGDRPIDALRTDPARVVDEAMGVGVTP